MVRQNDPLDFVTALGRLLSNPTLLDDFEADPAEVAESLNVLEQDRDVFLSLQVDQLRRQAETLLGKRWHEVKSLAPLTTSALAEQGYELFRFFASRHWPEGHRRHVIDAYQFLQFLAANRLCRPDRTELRGLSRRLKQRH